MPTVPFLGSYGDISGSGLMFRNKLVNGNFDVWQRGTSFTTNDVYSSDRWVTVVSGTCTHARESSDIPDGSQYVHRWTTGAASSFGQIKQYIETSEVVKLRGKTLTASCLVKSSAGFSGNAAFEIFYSTSTDSRTGFSGIDVGGSGSNGQVTSSGWTKITRTFTLPSTAVGLVIGIIPSVVQSSGVWLSMAQVQLEAGPQATPFEQRPIGTELILCERYFALQSAVFINGSYASSPNKFYSGMIPYRVMPRSIPNLSVFSGTAKWSMLGVNIVSSASNTGLTIINALGNYGFYLEHVRQAGGSTPVSGGSIYHQEADLIIAISAEL